MKLTNITKLIGIGVIALVLTGCGGGGSSSTGGGNNTGSTQPPVASSPFDNITNFYRRECDQSRNIFRYRNILL